MLTVTHPAIKQMSLQLIVAGLNHSIEFYQNHLGFDVAFLYEDFYAGIVKDGWSIHLKVGRPRKEERQNKTDNEHLDIIFSVDNIDGLYEHFTNKHIEIIQPLRQQPYGKEFYIADPDGYILAFLEEA
jgi:predicted enzyme related to lactoylglutathione lyase